QRPERMREEMTRNGSLAQFRLQIREDKCIAKLLESAKITEVKAGKKAKKAEKTTKKAEKTTKKAKKVTKKTVKKTSATGKKQPAKAKKAAKKKTTT
ncbi:MAG: hypothetical protein MUO22_00160, partial [Sedimentisphaerales bacterium]|nr:hypothetical protein [Sedimentisphaerales bacterium]